MNSDTAYKILQFVINKNQQGYFSPANFNTIFPAAELQYLDYLLGEFQQYQYGRPVPRVQFGMNETIRQSLTPLIGPPVSLTIDVNGLASYPGDFQQVDAIYFSSPADRVRFVAQDKLYSYLNSVIDPVATNPIYLIQSNGFQFYPIGLAAANLSYVKTPPQTKWAYTTDVNGRPVYDPANSVAPIWYDVDCFDVISRALKMIGVNLQAPAVMQYATELKNVGQ